MNQEDYLQHYGVLGMKWGKRKQPERSSSSNRRKEFKKIRKDQRATNKAYRAEYKQKKALGQSTKVGKGAKAFNPNATNYALVKTTDAMRKKYGTKKYSDFLKNERDKQLKASGALMIAGTLALVGATAVTAISSNNTTNRLISESEALRRQALSEIQRKQDIVQRFYPKTAKIQRISF